MSAKSFRGRTFYSSAVLASLGLFGGMGGTRAHAASEPASAHTLPAGVHLNSEGRYVKEFCGDPRSIHCNAHFTLPADWQPGKPLPEFAPITPMAAPPAGLSPTDLLTAYNVPASSSAGGKIVAIIDSADNHAFTDVNTYRTTYGIANLPKCSGLPTGTTACFAQVAEDGSPSKGTDPDTNADMETSLDMDMISAVCPDCSILLVELNTLCPDEILMAVGTAVKLGASAVSISLGGPEALDPNLAKYDAGPPTDAGAQCPGALTWTNDPAGPYSAPGHLVFVASGDFAYNNGNMSISGAFGGSGGGASFASPSYPASSPYVIAVGGTALYNTSGKYAEGVWNDGTFGDNIPKLLGGGQDVTTSGCSTEFDMPPWQASGLTGTGCNKRASADISAAATFFSGTTKQGIVICSPGLGTGACAAGVEGTSASSPIVAALFTRLGLTTEASNDLSWIYQNAAAFNDIGSTAYPIPSGGKNTDAPAGASCGKLCTAGAGWDGPSGVGSPNGTALAALPVSTAAPVPYPDAGLNCPTALADGGCNGSTSTPDASVTPPVKDAGTKDASTGTPDATIPHVDAGTNPGNPGTPDAASPPPSTGTDSGVNGSGGGGTGTGKTGGGAANDGGCALSSGPTSSFAASGLLMALAAFAARRRKSRG